MVKLIVTDMDGTLLNDNHRINDEFWEVFEELKAKGIVFASASGRQYYNLLKNLNRIKDDIYFLAENGTYIVHREKELFLNSIPKKEARTLIGEARKIEGGHVVLCGKKSVYLERKDPDLLSEVKKYFERYEVVEDLMEVEDDVLRVTICDFRGAEKNSYSKFAEYEGRYKITMSGNIWLDIMNKSANKGNAVKEIQKLLNIKPEETMVFGDYLNDVEMLENAYYSYAMKNAHPKLKESANFIAKSNNENGVVEKIKGMLL